MGLNGIVDPNVPQAALPAKVVAHNLRRVKVSANGREVICFVNDMGPWNTHDPLPPVSDRSQPDRGSIAVLGFHPVFKLAFGCGPTTGGLPVWVTPVRPNNRVRRVPRLRSTSSRSLNSRESA
jgi:hypothetical protein